MGKQNQGQQNQQPSKQELQQQIQNLNQYVDKQQKIIKRQSEHIGNLQTTNIELTINNEQLSEIANSLNQERVNKSKAQEEE